MAATAVLAGCVGDGDSSDDDSSESTDTDNGDDGSGGETSSDDGGTENGDGSGDGDDGTDYGSDDGSEGSSDSIEYSHSTQFILEATIQQDEMGGEISVTAYNHDGDMRQVIEGMQGMDTLEFYLVDDTWYQVVGEQCFEGQRQFESPNVAPEFDSEDDLKEWLPNDATGTDTIDGETVEVYEIDEAPGDIQGQTFTVYVSQETGFIRRIEAESYEANFHSWGDVDPIEPPDMECTDPSSGQGS